MRLRTQLLLLVVAVALSPLLVAAIYAGASSVLRQRTDVAQRDFPLAMRLMRDELPRFLAGEQETIDLPEGVALTVLDTENRVLFSSHKELAPGAAVDPRELLRASREETDTRTMLEPLFRDGTLSGTFLLSIPVRAIPALARPGWSSWPLRYGLVVLLPLAVIAAAGAWFIATGVNRSVTRLQRATRRIADGDLDFEMEVRGTSELASLARSFDAMRGTLKEETERRSRLLAAVSHDVKTPLTAIKGYLEAIADGLAEDRETRDRYLGIIAEKADLLGVRVSELIEYVRLSSSHWNIEPVPTGLATFHRELCDGIAGDAAVLKRRLRHDLSIPDRLTAPMDGSLMSRAYENILDNALRFTPEGGTVTVSASVRGDLEVRGDLGSHRRFRPRHRRGGSASPVRSVLPRHRHLLRLRTGAVGRPQHHRRPRLQSLAGRAGVARHHVRDPHPRTPDFGPCGACPYNEQGGDPHRSAVRPGAAFARPGIEGSARRTTGG